MQEKWHDYPIRGAACSCRNDDWLEADELKLGRWEVFDFQAETRSLPVCAPSVHRVKGLRVTPRQARDGSHVQAFFVAFDHHVKTTFHDSSYLSSRTARRGGS